MYKGAKMPPAAEILQMGLSEGLKALLDENFLMDYKIIVEGQAFPVHKVVMAAVSNYFKAMCGEGYVESKMDEVEVKGFSAGIVGKLLDFIYTGQEDVVADGTLQILHCAIYLQIPSVAKVCVKKLMEDLNIQNCLEILSAMIEYSFHEEVKAIEKFVETNFGNVMENYHPEVTSYEALQVLINLWERSEWEMFLCFKNWIYQDYENRIGSVNKLMSKVRFCLISPEDLQAILEMRIFHKTRGSWHDLVVNAVNYHQMPVNLKVLERSEQSQVKTEPQPAFFFVKSSDDIVQFYTLDDKRKWAKTKQNSFESLVLDEFPETVCLEVNNFLIICRSDDTNQDWQIFDPRSLTWFKMPSMERPKRHFALVHHNDILYTVGGKYLPSIPSYEMEQYSLVTNSWSPGHNLPLSLSTPAACVLGDTLYVSGGCIPEHELEEDSRSDGLYCLDFSSDNAQWERLESCPKKISNHQMCVLKRSGEVGLFTIDSDLDLYFYSPSNDQWSEITNTVRYHLYDHTWLEDGRIFVKGDSVVIINMFWPNINQADDDDDEETNVCWKIRIPENGSEITKVDIADFPRVSTVMFPDIFGAILAIPPQKEP